MTETIWNLNRPRTHPMPARFPPSPLRLPSGGANQIPGGRSPAEVQRPFHGALLGQEPYGGLSEFGMLLFFFATIPACCGFEAQYSARLSFLIASILSY